MKRNQILTKKNSRMVNFRVVKDDRITGDDVLITLKELFGLMEKVSNKIGTRITEAEWEQWTSGFHAEIQMDVEQAIRHREGLE